MGIGGSAEVVVSCPMDPIPSHSGHCTVTICDWTLSPSIPPPDIGSPWKLPLHICPVVRVRVDSYRVAVCSYCWGY